MKKLKRMMMKAKGMVIVGMVAVVLSCNRKVVQPPVVLHDSTSTNVQVAREVKEVQLPPDSAWLKALLRCDSLGNVYMSQLESLQGERVEQSLTISHNTLKVKATDTGRKTERVERRDSIITIYKEKPVEVPTPVYTNKLTQWQVLQMWIGRIALVALLVFALYKWVASRIALWVKGRV